MNTIQMYAYYYTPQCTFLTGNELHISQTKLAAASRTGGLAREPFVRGVLVLSVSKPLSHAPHTPHWSTQTVLTVPNTCLITQLGYLNIR